ncbi:hypothetical protein J6590_048579 [Homalodisca vitripennis]|nr:hypothetical protein J6590_048579 [Homalodisca vitripennis]
MNGFEFSSTLNLEIVSEASFGLNCAPDETMRLPPSYFMVNIHCLCEEVVERARKGEIDVEMTMTYRSEPSPLVSGVSCVFTKNSPHRTQNRASGFNGLEGFRPNFWINPFYCDVSTLDLACSGAAANSAKNLGICLETFISERSLSKKMLIKNFFTHNELFSGNATLLFMRPFR